MVVSSFPAFPVAAFPVQTYAAPANYTFNVPAAAPQNAPNEAALDALQRYLDDARAKAPTSCNGSKSMSPLQAPVPPGDDTESRLRRLEDEMGTLKGNMRSVQNSVEKILDYVKPRDGN